MTMLRDRERVIDRNPSRLQAGGPRSNFSSVGDRSRGNRVSLGDIASRGVSEEQLPRVDVEKILRTILNWTHLSCVSHDREMMRAEMPNDRSLSTISLNGQGRILAV